MSRTFQLLEVGFSAIDPKNLFFKNMRRDATSKKISSSESFIQCEQFLFLAKLVYESIGTHNQETLRLR